MFGDLLFDSFDSDSGGFSGAEGLAAKIVVHETTTIGGLGVYAQIFTAPVQIKFVIFDEAQNLLPVALTPQQYAVDSIGGWKYSTSFSYDLLPGTYFIGALDNLPGVGEGLSIHFDPKPNPKLNNLESQTGMAILSNFDVPVISGNSSSNDAGIRIFAPVPEPASLALYSIMGLAGLWIVRRRRRN